MSVGENILAWEKYLSSYGPLYYLKKSHPPPGSHWTVGPCWSYDRHRIQWFNWFDNNLDFKNIVAFKKPYYFRTIVDENFTFTYMEGEDIGLYITLIPKVL